MAFIFCWHMYTTHFIQNSIVDTNSNQLILVHYEA